MKKDGWLAAYRPKNLGEQIAEVKTARPSYEEIDKGIPEVKELFRDTFGI